MRCSFCDVPKVGPGRNASEADLRGQIECAVALHPEVLRTARLNVHFARMGEPTWNPAVLECSRWLRSAFTDRADVVHPVVSTMMPRHNGDLGDFLAEWMQIKNELYVGDAGLRLSINSTSETERVEMFSGNALALEEIAGLVDGFRPRGRKITLNFAVAGWEIDSTRLRGLFDPRQFIVKLTPMHRTLAAEAAGIRTEGCHTDVYPYAEHAAALRAAGYDVLVFIASEDEDLGRITCGNAILAGTEPGVE